MHNFVTHLECSKVGDHYKYDEINNLSKINKPLLVKYDLEKIKNKFSRKDFIQDFSQLPGFWKYQYLLPLANVSAVIDLGEVITPLVKIRAFPNLFFKDEGRLPTGSFKARGLALAVARAKELGIKKIAIPTNGNAGAALAAYASAAGIESYVFCPKDTPPINIKEAELQGAKTFTIDGLINDCGLLIAEHKEKEGWFDISTLKEPYRLEGKKTMGFELAEQLNWQLPKNIFYPTGGGTGLIGMWKAFNELKKLGWIDCEFPKMFAIQSSTCSPIVKAFNEGKDYADPWLNAQTLASGIRVPVAVGDFLILQTIRESNGYAIAVDDQEIIRERDNIATNHGFLACPEGAATLAGYNKALQMGLVDENEKTVLFNCATGLKYPMPEVNNKFHE